MITFEEECYRCSYNVNDAEGEKKKRFIDGNAMRVTVDDVHDRTGWRIAIYCGEP